MADDKVWHGQGDSAGIVDHNTLTEAVLHLKSHISDMWKNIDARLKELEAGLMTPAAPPKDPQPQPKPAASKSP